MWWPLDRRLHAGSVRSQESGPLHVSVVKSLVAAMLHRVNPWNSRLFLFSHGFHEKITDPGESIIS
jgi:hypothetical protein